MIPPDLSGQLAAIAADPLLASVGADSAAIASHLYRRHYCRPGQPELPPSDEGSFLESLRAANPFARRSAGTGELLTPGHYFVLGREPIGYPTGRQVRFYWNIGAIGAAALLARLGEALAMRRIPFQLKVPAHPGGYDRADGGVLYAAAEDVPALLDLLVDAHRGLGAAVRADVPLFVRRLAPGLGFAESPQTGESFGMQRCRLLAEGLVSARSVGSAPHRAMAERLASSGILAARPELNPGSAYPHDFGGMQT